MSSTDCDCVDLSRQVAAVVTLFKPQEKYIKNIKTYSAYVGVLYVVDNTPDYDEQFHGMIKEAIPNIQYISTGKNIGLSSALNMGIEKARENGYLWLLTMDQDSYFNDNQIKKYFDSIHLIDYHITAILSPMHRQTDIDDSPCIYKEKDIVWTSGNLLNIDIATKTGMFDEKLFIDSVDHEYCLRTRMNGYKILQASNCFLNHEIGVAKVVGFLRWKKKREFHSPKRLYFMIRNSFYLSDKYSQYYSLFIKKHNREVRREFIRGMKYSSERRVYIYYAIRAWLDYKRGVFGNAVNI
ncbi:MAG: glycosyltransferase [Chlorobiaceae bacterium]|nr:glycosyltransferase [Chlorobiaceae bacterium]